MKKEILQALQTMLEADAALWAQAEPAPGEETAMVEMAAKIEAVLATRSLLCPAYPAEAYHQALERADKDAQSPVLAWVYAVAEQATRLPQNQVDDDFLALAKSVGKASEAALMDGMKRGFDKWRKKTPKEQVDYFIRFQMSWGFWGRFDPEQGELGMLHQRAACLKQHLDDFVWLYYRLCDYRSRKTLLKLLQYWLCLNPDEMAQMHETQYETYFDLDLMDCDENEVFVDLGAYVGDTLRHYWESYGAERYNTIYCYEIVPENVKKLEQVARGHRNVLVRAFGAGAQNGVLYLPGQVSGNAARLSENGELEVPVVCLDDDITQPVTFIKMDIEGSEYDALRGAKRHIAQEHPKLAISLYHSNDDLWRLPRLIDSFYPNYRFYLRYNGDGPALARPAIIADYILLCVPNEAP